MRTKIDSPSVQLGVEVFAHRQDLKPLRFGMLTNALATNSELVPSVDVLMTSGFQIAALFVPEHGFYGAAIAGEKVASGYDEKRKVPVFSLYGETLKPLPEWLSGLDALLVDLPDVGCRFYTYAWTMSYLIEAAAESNLPVFVLDRPNPINGVHVEGKCQVEILGSLVGRFPIPIRHGMTLGELALWLQRNHFPQAQVEVIACKGWKRTMWWDETVCLGFRLHRRWQLLTRQRFTVAHALWKARTCRKGVELRTLLSGLERLSPTKMKSPICSTNWACPALGSDQSGSFLRLQSTPAKFARRSSPCP